MENDELGETNAWEVHVYDIETCVGYNRGHLSLIGLRLSISGDA